MCYVLFEPYSNSSLCLTKVALQLSTRSPWSHRCLGASFAEWLQCLLTSIWAAGLSLLSHFEQQFFKSSANVCMAFLHAPDRTLHVKDVASVNACCLFAAYLISIFPAISYRRLQLLQAPMQLSCSQISSVQLLKNSRWRILFCDAGTSQHPQHHRAACFTVYW